MAEEMNIHDACDYIIHRITSAGDGLSNLKLQKLLFYAQAWHLAHHGTRLFDGKFQAWVHGPVNREIFDRFRDTKMMYSEVTQQDIRPNFDSSRLSIEHKNHIDNVLEAYAGFQDVTLEDMTHSERPWLHARGGAAPMDRCCVEIDEGIMRATYSARLKSNG